METLVRQRTLANSKGDVETLSKVEARLEEVAAIAEGLGFNRRLDRRKRLSGINVLMPSATELVQQLSGSEIIYRILSGVAHHDPSTLARLVFGAKEGETAGGEVRRRAVPNDLLALLAANTGLAFGRATWAWVVYFGGSLADLSAHLEAFGDQAKVRDEYRFWRDGAE
jgi:hypothetical protein